MVPNLPELIIIFVVALLIFGPKKLPEMGAHLGRGINAFKKGMSEFNRSPVDSSFDMESFTAQQKELRALEARRLELEILERELAVKRAEAELKAVQERIAPYALQTTVDDDYLDAGTIVDADHVASEKVARTPAGLDEDAKPEKEAGVASDEAVKVGKGKEPHVMADEAEKAGKV